MSLKSVTFDICDYQAKRKEHIIIQSRHLGRQYDCNQCECQSTRNDTLSQHQQSVHNRIRYKCEKCNYQATQKSDLAQHENAFYSITL